MSKDSFVDEDFSPDENSLMGKTKDGNFFDAIEARRKIFQASEVEWKRISEIIPKPVIYEDIVSMKSVKYGRISLPYFYAVLSALVSKYPSIIQKIILTKEYNEKGKYQVKLFIDGKFQTITIDDYFPVIKGTNIFFFTRPSNFDFWTLIIEKAWAKVNKGYLNIVNLWPGDLFKALTGFSFEMFVHPELTKEEVFNKLNKIDKQKDLAIALTSDNKEIEQKGLFLYHMYVLEEIEEIEIDKNNYVNLIKLRDIDEESNWKGDYCPTSKLWTDKLKTKLGKNKFDLKEGEFWMSLEDFHKYFLRTDMCHMMMDGYTSFFEFGKSQLLTPKILNLYMQEDGVVSISVIGKNWKFHRELRNNSHPTSLVIAQYDPTNQKIKKVYSNYENNEDLEITETLTKGYYLIWVFKITDLEAKIKAEEMHLQICTKAKANVDLIGDDTGFEVIRNIIYQDIKEKNKDKIKNDFFYAVDNSFDKSGLGYEIIINPLTNTHQVWKVDSTDIYGFIVLPPHEKPEFELTIGYNDFEIILGIKRYKFGQHCFNLGIEVSIFQGAKEPPKVRPKQNILQFFGKNGDSLKKIKENPTFSSSEIKKVQKYPTLNHWDLFLEKHKGKYPLIMQELKKLEPKTDEKFDLNIIEFNKNAYIGENDYGIRLGRGAYIFGREGTTYIGYWDNGLQFLRGKVFDSNNKLVYEGEYKRGLKEGKGVYNYPGGEKYEGMFVNGLREGKGVFYWNNGIKWDGLFKNNNFNGQGTFSDGKDSFPGTFKDGDLVEN